MAASQQTFVEIAAFHEIEGKTMRQLSADGWQMIHEVAQATRFQ